MITSTRSESFNESSNYSLKIAFEALDALMFRVVNNNYNETTANLIAVITDTIDLLSERCGVVLEDDDGEF